MDYQGCKIQLKSDLCFHLFVETWPAPRLGIRILRTFSVKLTFGIVAAALAGAAGSLSPAAGVAKNARIVPVFNR